MNTTAQLDLLQKKIDDARKYINEAASVEERSLRKMEMYSVLYSYQSTEAIKRLSNMAKLHSDNSSAGQSNCLLSDRSGVRTSLVGPYKKPFPLREYQPLWEKVKSTVYKDCEVISFKGEVKISAAPKYHRRIFKAVMKEKYQDNDFRFHCNRLGLPFRLDTRTNPIVPYLLVITIQTGNAI